MERSSLNDIQEKNYSARKFSDKMEIRANEKGLVNEDIVTAIKNSLEKKKNVCSFKLRELRIMDFITAH